MPQFDLVHPAHNAEAAIRIDITALEGVHGKTTVAAVVARALKEAFPDTLIQVQNEHADFRMRLRELERSEPVRVTAQRIVVVDRNGDYRIPDDLHPVMTTVIEPYKISP